MAHPPGGRAGAQIVCLQELFRSEYFCREENPDWFDLAEADSRPHHEVLARLARELAVAIVGSVFERRAAGVYHNTAVVLDAGGELLGIYRKMHIPDDPLYYEKYYFTPGDLGFRCFDTRYARVAPLVCWDQWYPEAARLAALGGAQVLCYPTAIGWHPAEKAQAARPSTMPGAPSSALTPSPTASTWPPSTAWAMKGRPEEGWSSGADRSWPIPSDRC